MSKFRFRKLPRQLLAGKNQRLFGDVADGIASQVEGPFGVDADRIEGAPFAAQVVYWLWRFQCEAGANGFEVFLLEPLGIYAPQVHAALKEVGERELVRRMEAAIPWARKGPAEFNKLRDRSWFKQFDPVAEFPSLQSVDRGVYPIISSLTDAVEVFIRLNGDELFRLR